MSSVALDIGGTYLKGARIGPSGDLGPVTRRPIPAFLSTVGPEREIDPDTLLDAVHDLLATVMGDAPVDRILITGQMAGSAFIDDEGRAVHPVISWQDTRVRDVAAIEAALGPAVLTAIGDPIRPGHPLALLTAVPVPPGARYTSLLGFVAGALCGTRAPVLHVTDAAACGLLDVARGTWQPRAVEVAGLTLDDLPRVSSHVEAVGRSARFDCEVLCAIGDQQASLLGAGLLPGEVSMNIATGCQVSMRTDAPSSPAQLRPYVDGTYLRTITHLPAGRLLTAAVADAVGHAPSEADWSWAQDAIGTADPRAAGVASAVEQIADACVAAARRIGADTASGVRFSGGLAQRFMPIQERIVAALALPFVTYAGDDAALAGLAAIDRKVAI